ncbi:G2/mitotic-specific cyclin S13-7-like isoform X2 [Ananas comosus]|uniref:G2/mitotic-specific cyclin S13-7-like isoform X2 n=1 Tax=Ananas comosus TaxID=4615 RepID=A0A6P5G0P3_ANACO|nr:G2/mitotic-specific cyclin S13-7-like isoform X2 [Ananas comosus]
MASRHHIAISQQQRGGVAPVNKQKAAAGADGKNRRALEDIGNLANLRINEGDLFLKNCQHYMQKQVAVPTDRIAGKGSTKATAAPVAGVAGKGAAKAPKSAAVKPEPENVIEISTDSDESATQVSASSVSFRGGKPSRKEVHTLTSVLTARSKIACGVIERPKELALNIDASDADDQLAVVDYVEDIYIFYKHAENSNRPRDYIHWQAEISMKMRSILADWIIEVHHRFELMPETLYLTFCIIDRYLSIETVTKGELQLVGVSAMLIACKYEEIWAPEVNDFICISDRAYTREQILGMEKGILNKLEWNLTVPTCYVFLVRFLKASACDKEMEHMVFFFAELGLMQYSMIMYCPSMVAASAVYAARCTLRKSPLWTETLKHHTGFSEQQLLDAAQILVKFHSVAHESKLRVVYKKYSNEELGAVALHPPATRLIEDLLKASKK